MTLALLYQFTAQYVSDVNTSIFRSLWLLGALFCRLYGAVMIDVYVLIYLSSGKCYTYIMCRVWLWVSVLLQVCGVLWFLNSRHNNAPSSRKLLKMDVLTPETCWAVNWHNKASVIKLVYLYSNFHSFLSWNHKTSKCSDHTANPKTHSWPPF